MPNGANRQFRQTQAPPFEDLPSETQDFSDGFTQTVGFVDEEELLEDDVDIDVDNEDLEHGAEVESSAPPPTPPGLKEISSLACWTVSSSKPGCSVTALRTPNTNFFWQSDGPQPHHLNIHFFKMVAIAGMRIYLNFDLDESYTPTLIRFAAGTGYHDLQEFSVMKFERPTGWIDVDWEGVGDIDSETMDGELSILRCMLVQVRICENHQNGKDTHLRGLQIFSRDSTPRSNERNEAANSINVGQNDQKETRRKSTEIWDLGGWMDTPVLR